MSCSTPLLATMLCLLAFVLDQAAAQAGEDPAVRLHDAPGQAPPPQVAGGPYGFVADQLGDLARGLRVLSVVSGGRADAAGLRPGDWIVMVNGQRVDNLEQMVGLLQDHRRDALVTLDVTRDGNRHVLTLPSDQPLRAARQSQYLEPVPASPPGPLQPLAVRATLGVTVAPITEQARVSLALSVTQGAIITGLQPGGPADREGLPLGGVIVSFDGQRIDAPVQLQQAMAVAQPGQEVELGYYQGSRLLRKRLRLAPAARPLAAPDHERTISPSATEPPIPSPPDSDALAEALRRLDALQRQLDQLQVRVQELEQRLEPR